LNGVWKFFNGHTMKVIVPMFIARNGLII
jgi:hypothetical protein